MDNQNSLSIVAEDCDIPVTDDVKAFEDALGESDDDLNDYVTSYQSKHLCPRGGDVSDDCADCVYGEDYHYDPVSGDCIVRMFKEDNDE